MRRAYNQDHGFTIVELLIVVVVIAILAAISLVAYSNITNRAQASAIVSDLKAAEKAFHSYKAVSGPSTWWVDSHSALTGVGNPQISAIITAQPEFRQFLQQAPSTAGLDTNGGWFYDNDNDTYSGCAASLAGVNIGVLMSSASPLMQAVDNAIDDGNLACGKLRYASGYLLYAISNSP